MAFRRARIPWAGLTIALALGMIVAGVGFPDAAMGKAAAISSESQERSVEGREPPKVKEFKGAEDRVSPPKPRKPVWPKPGQAEVELDDSAKWKSVGTLPVRVARPPRTESIDVKAGKAEANALADTVRKAGLAAQPPARVHVETLAPEQVAALGGVGIGVRVARADGVTHRGRIRLALSYRDFSEAYGGGFARRLRVVRLPACALATPRPADCKAVPVDVPAVNNVKAGEIVVDVEVASAAQPKAQGASAASSDVFLLAASAQEAPQVGGGTFAATDLKPSGTWQAGSSGGSFGWSFPLPKPPSPAGNGPDLELTYDSAAVESMSWAANPQSGWAGLGWSLPTAFIERRFPSCSEEGVMPTGLDELQCWEFSWPTARVSKSKM